jgi:hypothetical protein
MLHRCTLIQTIVKILKLISLEAIAKYKPKTWKYNEKMLIKVKSIYTSGIKLFWVTVEL